MTNKNIEQLIIQLSQEVDKAQLDDTTIKKLREFERHIEPYISAGIDNNNKHTLIDQAKQLEIEFAQRYPIAEGTLREIIDTLGKMGI